MIIETFQNPEPEDYQVLIRGISRHAHEAKGIGPAEHYASFIRDSGQIIGGVGGYVYLGCLSIEKLWVHPDFRGQGLAQQLLESIENTGRKKQCRFATLCTTDWEDLGFYQKHGYVLEFQREGYDFNSTYYYLRKNF